MADEPAVGDPLDLYVGWVDRLIPSEETAHLLQSIQSHRALDSVFTRAHNFMENEVKPTRDSTREASLMARRAHSYSLNFVLWVSAEAERMRV